MKFADQLKRLWAITKKDLAVYYGRGPVLIQGLLIPAFLFVSFAFRRNVPLSFLMPGLIGMALFFAVSAITPVIAPWETRMNTFERLISAPIALWAILLGDVLASVLFGLFITIFVLLGSVVLLGPVVLNFFLLAGVLIAAFCFSSLGILMSAPPADKPSDIMVIATLIKFPLLFVSGVFMPLSEMEALRFLAYFSPLTYLTDLARGVIQGSSYFTPALNLAALVGFTVVFFVTAVKWHQLNLDKRF